jgi:hypothetical protein
VPLKNDWQNGDTFTPAAANDMANLVNSAVQLTTASEVMGIRTKTSTTYGTGYVFGTGSSFGFAGSGSPAEIAGAFGIYQEFGKADPGETIHKTTQGGYCIAAYFGPTDDDVMECLSAITILSDTTSVGGSGPYTQHQRVAGFECGVQVFGNNRIEPDGIQESYASAAGAKIRIAGTGFIDRAYAYRAAWDTSSTGTCREWAAFYQATSPGASATGPKYGVYVIDPVVSETSVVVGKGGSTGEFSVNRTGGADSFKSFMLLSLPSQADAGGASCSGIRIIAASDHSGKNLQQWEKSGEETPYLRVGSTGLLQGRVGFTLVDSTFSTAVVNINSAGIQLADTKVIELGHASDTTLSRSAAGKLAVEGVDVLLTGGALGTPSSATLTNATGLPVSGITSSTATALGVGSVELGHASDTTLSRSAAGKLAVEGVEVLLTGGALGTPSSGTLTNCTFPTLNQSTSGNAATATTLETARTISGVSFNGSTDIDVVTAKTVGQSFFPSGYVSGNYYYANGVAATGTSAIQGNGTVRLTPWVVTDSITITRLFAEFTVAGDANSIYRIGIWSHDQATGKPTTLVLDAGSISTGTGNAGTVSTGGTPGIYEITVSQALTPGLYWVGGAVQGVSSVQPTMRTVANYTYPLYIPLGASLPAANATFGGMAIASQTGALATTSSASVSSISGARIGFKVS